MQRLDAASGVAGLELCPSSATITRSRLFIGNHNSLSQINLAALCGLYPH